MASLRRAQGRMVGATGFEPAASCSQSKRSAKLSYAPYPRDSITVPAAWQGVSPWPQRPLAVCPRPKARRQALYDLGLEL